MQRIKNVFVLLRIPTAQIKRVMQKDKKVMIKVQKHIRKVVPQSSKLHAYLSRKSSALFRRLNDEFFAISDHKHKSAKKQRLNFSRKYYQSRYSCCTKLESLCLLFVQNREPDSRATAPLELVHTDLAGPVTPRSRDGHK